ncbi:hypothetical protein QTP86_013015 [Hemibagrus guttatus]|nr:hypothetical protein QTP86_013015 [Hemibagrus guttatus]
MTRPWWVSSARTTESAYREEMQQLIAWCKDNNLSLNIDKTKEMVVDFRRAQSDHSPLIIDGSPVEIIKRTKFLGVHLAENFTSSLNTTSISKKAQQHLYFLRRLRKTQRECPEQLHHCLVWEVHCFGSQDPEADSEDS